MNRSRVDAQNVILLSSNAPWTEWLEGRILIPGSWQDKLTRSRVPVEEWPNTKAVLTDDWNPVDAVIARQLIH